MHTNINNKLEGILKKGFYTEFDRLFSLNRLRMGGKSDYFLIPKNTQDLAQVLNILSEHDVPYYFVGDGCNSFFLDVVPGAVISTKNMRNIKFDGNTVTCDSGVYLSQLLKACKENNLTGLEFTLGIPGTVGGAFVSKARIKQIYGHPTDESVEIGYKVKSVNAYYHGQQQIFSHEECEIGYKTSIFMPYNVGIISAEFELEKASPGLIEEKLAHYRSKREEYPVYTLGSTFKNPDGLRASELIEASGFPKGYRHSKTIRLSQKSANVLDLDVKATPTELVEFLKIIQHCVYEKKGILLEKEIFIIPDDPGLK